MDYCHVGDQCCFLYEQMFRQVQGTVNFFSPGKVENFPEFNGKLKSSVTWVFFFVHLGSVRLYERKKIRQSCSLSGCKNIHKVNHHQIITLRKIVVRFRLHCIKNLQTRDNREKASMSTKNRQKNFLLFIWLLLLLTGISMLFSFLFFCLSLLASFLVLTYSTMLPLLNSVTIELVFTVHVLPFHCSLRIRQNFRTFFYHLLLPSKKDKSGFSCPTFDCLSYIIFFIISIFIVVR